MAATHDHPSSITPGTVFLVVGDGEVKEELIGLVRSSGISQTFVFAGRVPYEEVPLYIAASDVCVAPGTRELCETIGISRLKVVEYMACGRPVVATDMDGACLVRESNGGILVPLEDSAALAKAIVELLRDGDLRRIMGESGRRYVVENLSWDIVARKLIDAYEAATTHAGRRRLHS